MIKLEGVNKYFNRHKKNEIHVINNTTLDLGDKGLVTLLGPSGCGKTTLLNTIGGLDKISKGSIYVDGEKITKKTTHQIDKIRSLKIGYIFQDYNLIDNLSVFDNVALVLKMNGLKDKKEIKKRVEYVLDKVGMSRYKNRYANMLSGGERQRVGIARAIVKNPKIIIADEPTGNLDSKNTIEVMNIIKAISKDRLVILVTHEKELAEFYSSRIIEISDGSVVKDKEVNHNDDLDYRMDSKIYLKDIKNKEEFKNKKTKINFYHDEDEKLELNIVIKNGNIYIESKTNEKIEVIDDASALELVDDHYKKISKKDYEEYSFDFESIIENKKEPKYSSIYNIFTLLKTGFKRVFSYGIIKKLLLLGFMASSMFIVFSVSTILAAINIKKEDYISYNENYLIINKKNMSVDEYNKLASFEKTDYILPGDSMVSLNIPIDDYYQSKDSRGTITGSLSTIDMITEKDLISGRMPENSNEIVVDKMSLQNSINKTNSFKFVGITSFTELVDRKVIIGDYNENLKEYKIVGVTDLSSPSIYAYPSEFLTLISNSSNGNDYDYNGPIDIMDYNLYKDKIYISKGYAPTNDYEVVVNESYDGMYEIGKTINKKVNGVNLKVVGYYHSATYLEKYLVTENTIKINQITKSEKFAVYSKEKEETLNYYKEEGQNITDSFMQAKEDYIESVKPSIISKLVFSGIILVISIIEIFLIIRSSFLSRVKEVGILRAIGLKKLDIYKMFSGEILAITIVASTPGLLLMTYILKELSGVSMLSRTIVMNGYTFIISAILIVGFNLLFGLIPVYRTIRKTPARILSRTDL